MSLPPLEVEELRMGCVHSHRRAGVAAALAGLLLMAGMGLTACDDGGGSSANRPSARASERSVAGAASGEPDATRSPAAGRTTKPVETTRPAETTEPAKTTRPARTTAAETPEPTRTTGTTTPAEATTRPPTSTAVVAPGATSPTRTAATTETTKTTKTTPTPAGSASAAAAAAESRLLGPWGWMLLLVVIAALVVGGFLVYRSQRRSAWDVEARALGSETRTVTGVRLPPVLSTTTVGERGLAWPPVRASLLDLQQRWNALIERAAGETRRDWSLRISGLLQELVTAVDAENEAMVAGRDRMPARSRIRRAEEALIAILTGQPQPEPPTAGEPGPPAFQT
ncbi:hypothetical protein AB0J80_09410 [Actinoplanes sp. NPDC049548]|uniref:hypothetical protein n=1 Tax=Actinoplanes sp. NPDC049548 TaxID=3155152 RepID=UPI00343A55A9